MAMQLGIVEFSLGVLLLATLQFIVPLWLSERFKATLQKENAVFLEGLRWDLKVRGQAAKVAEYMAIAKELPEEGPDEDYRTANRLSWELAMRLPPDVYRALGQGTVAPNEENNPLSVVAVRRVLLGEAAGNLSQDDITHHTPGIGRRSA